MRQHLRIGAQAKLLMTNEVEPDERGRLAPHIAPLFEA
jgi:hypothetical protein